MPITHYLTIHIGVINIFMAVLQCRPYDYVGKCILVALLFVFKRYSRLSKYMYNVVDHTSHLICFKSYDIAGFESKTVSVFWKPMIQILE